MIMVKQLLKTKGNDVWVVSPHTPVYEALKLMGEKRIGAVPVVEEGRLVGIFSERDYARQVIQLKTPALDLPVGEMMTQNVYTVHPNQMMEDCMELMTEKRIRHLPVVMDNQLVGLISIGDVVKEIISDRETFIQDLQNYIIGTV